MELRKINWNNWNWNAPPKPISSKRFKFNNLTHF